LTNPGLITEECQAESKASKRKKLPVIIDEVQKIPALLDEVHWLIENAGIRFILCGSSARKVKRGQANLLGGRAVRYELHPEFARKYLIFRSLKR
jgi:predicted AAA+ superfamily ATPase